MSNVMGFFFPPGAGGPVTRGMIKYQKLKPRVLIES